MRISFAVMIGGAAVVGLLGLAPTTALAATATVRVTPTTVAAGGSVVVSGTCEASTSGVAISSAFLHDATHDFAGVGAVTFATDAVGAYAVTAVVPASRSPGTYPVSVRCGGGLIGQPASVVVLAALPVTGLGDTLPLLSGLLVCVGAGLVVLSRRAVWALPGS